MVKQKGFYINRTMNSAYIPILINKSPPTLNSFKSQLDNRFTGAKQSMVNKDKRLLTMTLTDFLLSTSLLTPSRHYIISLRDRWRSFGHVMATTYKVMLVKSTVQNECKNVLCAFTTTVKVPTCMYFRVKRFLRTYSTPYHTKIVCKEARKKSLKNCSFGKREHWEQIQLIKFSIYLKDR